MFTYNRDEIARPAIERAIARASDPDQPETSLSAVCRHLGRVIVGWLTVIIVIEVAVKYWGGQP